MYYCAEMGIEAPKSITACRRFFKQPSHPRQRMYEALRAYFIEARASHEVARAFGYSAGSFRVLCHQFRRDPSPRFFASPKPGPREQPKKSKAHELAVALRKQNRSVYEIAEALKEHQTPLSPTAVREVLRAEGTRSVRHGPDQRQSRWPMCGCSPWSPVPSSPPAVAGYSCSCPSWFAFKRRLWRAQHPCPAR